MFGCFSGPRGATGAMDVTDGAALAGAVHRPGTSALVADCLRQSASKGCSLAAGRERDPAWELHFLIWTARNLLKSRNRTKESKRIQAHFLGPTWSGFGSAWRNLAGAFSGGSGPLIPEPAGVRHVAAFFIRRRPHRLYRRIPRRPRPRRADAAHSRLRLELSHQLGQSALGRDADPSGAARRRLRQPRPRREPEALRPARLSLGRHGARRGEPARPPENRARRRDGLLDGRAHRRLPRAGAARARPIAHSRRPRRPAGARRWPAGRHRGGDGGAFDRWPRRPDATYVSGLCRP